MLKKALSVLLIFSVTMFARDYQTERAKQVTQADEERWEQRVSSLGVYPRAEVVSSPTQTELGRTWYDYATNNTMGRMLSYAPNGIHFAFMKRAGSATATRYVTYDYFEYNSGIFFGNQSVTESRQTGWGRVLTGKDGEAIISLHNNPTQMWFDGGEGFYSFTSNPGAETNPGVFAGIARKGDELVFITQGASWLDGVLKYSPDYGATWTSNSLFNNTVGADLGESERWPSIHPSSNEVSHVLSPGDLPPWINGSMHKISTSDWGANWTATLIHHDDSVFTTVWGNTQYIIENFSQHNTMYTSDGSYNVVIGAVQGVKDTLTSTIIDYWPILYWNDSDKKFIQVNDTAWAAPADSNTMAAMSAFRPGNGLGNAYPHISEGPNGELLVVFQQWEASPLDGSIVTVVGSGGTEVFMTDIWGAFSPDGGKTWSYTFKVAGTPGQSDVFPNLPETFSFDGNNIVIDLAYMHDVNPGVSLFAGGNDPAEAIWYYERVLVDTTTLDYKPPFVTDPVAQEYNVLFQVNMEVQILVDNFDPNNAADIVFARGNFNGWGEGNPMSPNIFDPNIYETVADILLEPVTQQEAYKYFYRSAAQGDVWESGSDRLFSATGNETDTDGDGKPNLDLPLRYFDGVGPDDIFTTNTDIIFEVNMTPAIQFLADSGAITFGGGNVTAVDTVYLAGGAPNTDPQLAWVWDLPAGNATREALQMNDGGTGGDATAGDDIWSITIQFQAGAPKTIDWKHGLAGFDNEAGFAENHNENVADVAAANNGRVFKMFGENGLGAGKSNWYQPYLGIEDLDGDFFNQPEAYALFQNYPNPFNPSTTIEFALTKATNVKLEIFNIVGQKVRTLISERVVPGGYQVVWDGRDDKGQSVGTGVYLYRLSANDFVQTRKMLLVK